MVHPQNNVSKEIQCLSSIYSFAICYYRIPGSSTLITSGISNSLKLVLRITLKSRDNRPITTKLIRQLIS